MKHAFGRYSLIGLVGLLILISIAGQAAAAVPSPSDGVSSPPLSSGTGPAWAGVDCAQVQALGLDRMMNLAAGNRLIECGYSQGGSPPTSRPGSVLPNRINPAAYGGTDADVILPDGTGTHVTQSESFVWANATTIVVNYNDSRTAPTCYSGISYSTDGGATWHASQALCTSTHGTNEGDPIVVYNARLATWYAGDLAVGGNCGGGSTGGIGLWTSPNGQTWTVGACAHVGTQRRPREDVGGQQPGQPLLWPDVCLLEQLRGQRRPALRHLFGRRHDLERPCRHRPHQPLRPRRANHRLAQRRRHRLHQRPHRKHHRHQLYLPLDQRWRRPGPAHPQHLQPRRQHHRPRLLLPRHPPDLAGAGVGPARRQRPDRRAERGPLYLRRGRLRRRPGRHLLYPLDRQRQHLGRAAQAQHRRHHPTAVAALYFGLCPTAG